MFPVLSMVVAIEILAFCGLAIYAILSSRLFSYSLAPLEKVIYQLGVVSHSCNCSSREAEVGGVP